MNFLKEAHSAFDFATYCPLLYKAIADNDSTTPGYIYEEIIKISFLSHQHRVHLLDFLFVKLPNLGWSGKQKVVRILFQLCQKGHYEIRIILRTRDGELRKAASQGGPPDPVLANTPQLFFNSSIQELLGYLFDQSRMKMDEELRTKGEDPKGVESGTNTGYGASSSKGKYEGFGSTPVNKPDSLVDQVREMVEKVVVPESRKREELEGIMKVDKGSYQPFSLHSSVPPPLIQSRSHSLSMSSSFASSLGTSVVSPRSKPHVVGKVGGGWESDEDDNPNEDLTLTLKQLTKTSTPDVTTATPSVLGEPDHVLFVQKLLDRHTFWPIDYDDFISSCKECSVSNPIQVIQEVARTIRTLYNQETLLEKTPKKRNESGSKNKKESLELKERMTSKELEETMTSKASSNNPEDSKEHNIVILLLFVEFGLSEDLLSLNLLQSYMESVLLDLSESKLVNPIVRLKSKKLYLTIKALAAL